MRPGKQTPRRSGCPAHLQQIQEYELVRASFHLDDDIERDLSAVAWEDTVIGPPDAWPPSLHQTLRMVLGSRFPMWFAWGPELTFFCNDAYRRVTLGAKYPWALGKPASVVWSEIWDDIGPRIDRVLTEGESTWDEQLRLILERSGYPEETYHTFSYSPLVGEGGDVVGMLCVVSEDTEEVIANRRIRALRDLAAPLRAQLTEAETLAEAGKALDSCSLDLPFHLLYVVDDDGSARLAWSGEIPSGHPAAPYRILPGAASSPWPPTSEPLAVSLDPARFPDLPTGEWPTPPTQAVVLPVPGVQGMTYGFMVAGLNPYRPFDEAYRDFLELVSAQVGAAITDARAYDAERRRAQSLAELDRAKTDFFTNVSHEFRTPLTLLLGPAEDALADTADPLSPTQRDRVALIERSGRRLLKLVNTLLDFSQLEAGGIASRFEPVDLAAYTRQLASMFAGAAGRLGLDLRIVCEPLPEEVYVDADLWGKVVLNLLSNAMKFTLEGSISVTLAELEGMAVLSVSDTGPGIPEEDRANLFKRFHRVRGVKGRSHEGSGIGLALVSEAAQIHGGSAAVSSTLGSGSTFTVSIPLGRRHLPPELVVDGSRTEVSAQVVEGFLAEAAQLVPSEPTVVQRSADTDPPRVLVVDDNADIRQYISRLLSPFYEVETAVDGRAALEAARARVPDLVLTDVMMPELDGFELLQALRRDPATVGVPLVMLSARGGEDATLEGLDAGADDYLIKPFSARELLARVRSNLELDRTRRVRRDLERTQELLNEAQRLAHVGSWSVDLDTGRVETSAEFRRIIGCTQQEIETVGHPDFFVRLVEPGNREFVRAVIGQARAGEELAFEVRMVRTDGSTFFAHVHGVVSATEEERPVLRATIQDVTQRRRTAEAVAAANAAAEVAAREHAIADELQSSLLPAGDYDLPLLDVATFYRAGSQGTKVGGDWFDVIEIGDGRTGLVLGDVMGHGVRAAAVMGQIRTAVRAYARLGMPPRPLMDSLDHLVRDLFPDQIVTCIFAVFDPDSLVLDFVNAGHLPPVLLHDDGSAELLATDPHPPLGLGHSFDTSREVLLQSGSGVLLYTDGLVERRGRDLEEGVAKLLEVVTRLDVELAKVPEAIVTAMLPTAPSDDVALLLAKVGDRQRR